MSFKQRKMSKTGFLELVIGPMFSGKTSTILELERMYNLSNLKTCVINYAEDTRYSDEYLSTHDKVMIPCVNSLTISGVLTKNVIDEHDVFLINEGQFFADLYDSVVELVEEHGKIVHVCGLDGDFKRNGFVEIIKLIPLADKITKKTAICMSCKDGTPALFCHRISKETEVKVIGSDNYIPVCRKCYLELHKKSRVSSGSFDIDDTSDF